MGKFILTSTGLSSPKIKQEFVKLSMSIQKKCAVIITTAAEGKSRNKFCVLAKKQLLELGFDKVIFLDLENDDTKSLLDTDLIYVAGGNTFKLMKFVKKQKLIRIIDKILTKDVIYIGVSAGSIILGKSVEIASADGDTNEVGLKNLSGLRLINYDIYPHYMPFNEDEIIKYENNHRTKVLRIADNEAIVYDNKIKYIK